MSDFKCPACLEFFTDKTEFVDHIKSRHECSIKVFCEKLIGKKDMFSGEPIEFKSLEQYLLTDFSGKRNMLNWMKRSDLELVKKFIFDKIKKFSFLKSVSIFPSSSEIRTISFLPSIKTIEYFFKDVNSFIDSTGLKRRYNYNLPELKLNLIFAKNTKPIVVDTREQKPLLFKNLEFEVKKVEFGDYTCDGLLAVERKSLNDLISTLSSGFERFKKEIDRAKAVDGYIVVVVDCDINKYLSFSFSSKGFLFGKASPDFIFHRMRELSRLFPEHIQFCFSGGRKESAILVPKILSSSVKNVSNMDLQFLIEKGAI